MSSRDVQRLRDMRHATQKALSFTENRNRSDLDRDEMLALALVRLLEIIGEAARYVPVEIKEKYPEVPWSQIASTRNRLIHGYFAVDLDIVWSIVRQDLPSLLLQLEGILHEN